MLRARLVSVGLGVLLLAVLAFGAGMAQAEAGASWGYMGIGEELKKFDASLEPSFKAALNGGDGSLLTKIGGNAAEFLCTSISTVEGKLKPEGAVLGSFAFHSCITKINGVTSTKCEPNANGTSKGTIETLKLKGAVLLHALEGGAKDPTVLLEPDAGSNAFAHIELGEFCSLGENVLVGGKLSLQDAEGAFSSHRTSHSAVEFGPLTHLWAISDTAEHKATIDSGATVSLTGAHEGMKWAGSPQ